MPTTLTRPALWALIRYHARQFENTPDSAAVQVGERAGRIAALAAQIQLLDAKAGQPTATTVTGVPSGAPTPVLQPTKKADW